MASLDHPNITKVIDFEDEGNLLCIIKKEGHVAAFWTTTQVNQIESIAMILTANNNQIILTNTDVCRGLSIRCIQE